MTNPDISFQDIVWTDGVIVHHAWLEDDDRPVVIIKFRVDGVPDDEGLWWGFPAEDLAALVVGLQHIVEKIDREEEPAVKLRYSPAMGNGTESGPSAN